MNKTIHIKLLLLFSLSILFGHSALGQLPDFNSSQSVCLGETKTYTAYGAEDAKTMVMEVYRGDKLIKSLTPTDSVAETFSSVTYKKYTFSRTWSEVGTFKVYVREFSVVSCDGVGGVVTVTVVDLPNTPTGDTDQSLCIGSTVSDLSASSGSNGIYWYASSTGVDVLANTKELEDGTTYYAEASNSNSCVSTERLAVKVGFKPDTEIALSSAIGTDNQLLCVNTSMTDITYAITNGTGATVSGLPAGVSGSYASGEFTISGTPAVSGAFLYSVIASGECASDTIKGTIIVSALPGTPKITVIAEDGLVSTDNTVCASETTTLSVDSTSFADYSMHFDGVDDYLGVSTDSIFNYHADLSLERTVMFWFKPEDITSRQVLYKEGHSTNGFVIYINSDTIYAYGVTGGKTWSVPKAVLTATDQWYHFAYTWNHASRLCKAYLNGNLVNKVTENDTLGVSQTGNAIGYGFNVRFPDIGKGTDKDYYFKGNIDNFKFWTSELSQDQIISELSAVNAKVSDVVLDYNFDDYNDRTPTSVANSTSVRSAYIKGADYESSIVWDDNDASTTFTSTNFSVDVKPTKTTTYTATVSNKGACSTSTNVTLTVNPIPTAIAGGSSTICPSGSVTVAGASSSYGTIKWTHDGDGLLDDATTLAPTYHAVTGDLGKKVTLTMTVTGENSCGGDTAIAYYYIDVADSEAPVITDMPSDIYITNCKQVVNWDEPKVTDNCGNPSLSSNYSPGTVFPVGETTVTYIANDGTNTVSKSFKVTVEDGGEAPLICFESTNYALKKPATQSSDYAGPDGGAFSAVDGNTNGVFTDGSVTHTTGTGENQPWWEVQLVKDTKESYEVSYINIYNRTGSLGSRLNNFYVMLSENPFQSDDLNTLLLRSDVVSYFFSGIADEKTSLLINNINARYVRIQLSGDDGRLSLAEVEVMGCNSQTRDDISVNTDAGKCTANVTWDEPTSVDNCGTVILKSNHNSGEDFPVGTTTVTYTATDGTNTTTSSFDVIVTDKEKPVARCKDITVELDKDGQARVTVAQIDNGSSDNCDIASMSLSKTDFDCDDISTDLVVSSSSNDYSVSIKVWPISVVPSSTTCDWGYNYNVELGYDISFSGSKIPASLSTLQGTLKCDDKSLFFNLPNTEGVGTVMTQANAWRDVSDCATITPETLGCTDVSIQIQGPGISNQEIPSPLSSPNAVVLTVVDNSGNTSTCTANVTVVDNIAPTASNPADISVQCKGDIPAADPKVVADAADNCSTPTVAFVSDSDNGGAGTTTSPYIITRTYSVTDDSDNSINVSQTITVIDDIDPVTPTLADVTGECSATAVAPTTTDNCAGTITGKTTDPLTYSTQGTHVIAWTFDDGNGNVINVPQNVIITDITDPVISNCPSDITVGACNNSVNWTEPTATDNCSVTLTSTHNSGDVFPVGTTTVTYTATDGASNAVDCSFDVTVLPAVTIDLNETNSIVCNGSNAQVTVTAGGGTGAYTYSSDGTSYQVSNVFSLPAGNYTLYVKDGNSCVAKKDITIKEPTAILTNLTIDASNICFGDAGIITIENYEANVVYTLFEGTSSLAYTSIVSGADLILTISASILNAEKTYNITIKAERGGCILDMDTEVYLTVEHKPTPSGINY